jgi:hypothetical protein
MDETLARAPVRGGGAWHDGSARSAVSAGRVGLLALAAVLVTSLPLLAVTYPPLHDYPFHLARIQILAHFRDWPVLQEFYRIGSFVLPNVAMDVVLSALAQLLPVAVAGRVFIAMIFALLVSGTIALHRTVHGRWSLWPLVSAVFLYNWILLFGFVNYLFGLGLMLWGVVLWIRIAPQPVSMRLAVGTIVAVILFFAHLAALGVYAVLVAGFELQRAFGERQPWPRTLRRLAIGALPFAVPLGLLLFASPTGNKVGAAVVFNLWPGWKPLALYRTLLSGDALLDAVTPIVLGLALAAVLVAGAIRIAPPMRLALAALSLTFLAAPTDLMGALWLDARLPVALAFVAIASTEVRFRRPAIGRAATIMIAALLLFRGVAMSASWIGYERIEDEFVAAFAKVPAGSTLFLAAGGPMPSLLYRDDAALALWRPPLKHTVSLATVLKPIFVPATWADPTQQPIVVTPRYAAMKALQGNNPVRIGTLEEFVRLIGSIREAQRSAADSRPVYLLLVDPDPAHPERPPDIVPVAAGSRFELFEIAAPY